MSCGLPIISDYHNELHRLFGNEISLFRNKEEFNSSVDLISRNKSLYFNNYRELSRKVADSFSFRTRAEYILDLVENPINSQTSSSSSDRGYLLTRKKIKSIRIVKKILSEGFENKSFKFLCPICGALIFKDRDEHFICPHCGSNKNNRALWIILLTKLNFIFTYRKCTIIHVDPEPAVAKLLNDKESIIYITASFKSEQTMVLLHTNKTDFPSCSIDLIIYQKNIYNHVEATLLEFHRILKPGGVLITGDLNINKDDNINKALITNAQAIGYRINEASISSELQSTVMQSLDIQNNTYKLLIKKNTLNSLIYKNKILQLFLRFVYKILFKLYR
jgi:SAM-dependent methyltransferase